MSPRRVSVLLVSTLALTLAGCSSKTPAKAPPLAAVPADPGALPPLRKASREQRKQLEHAMWDMQMALSQARHDTANPPRWSAEIDRVADELPDPDPRVGDASYRSAYQALKSAIDYARWRRLDDCKDQLSDGFRFVRDTGS
jgi:hypothetical protein